jgi:outer membrane receptor protein involved in Fe transport
MSAARRTIALPGAAFSANARHLFPLGVVRLPHAGLEGSPAGIVKGIVAVPAAASGKRDWNVKNIYFSGLKAGAAPMALALALCSGQAFAQDDNTAPADQPAASGAQADQAPAQVADAGDNGVIVVTGSRIRTALPTTVAPVQVVSSEQIESSGVVNIQQELLENPVFGTPTFTRANNAFNTSGLGTATVDLRNLGIDRTLVLINGRRVVSGVPGSAAADLNFIPTHMLDRVEVLTSGSASAIYGSDAVAGVVNFILKDHFQGIEFHGQYGISEVGDNQQLDTGVLVGGNFADDRGNVTLYAGYSRQNAAYAKDHRTEQGPSDVDSISSIFFGGDIFDKTAPFYSGFNPEGTYFSDNFAWTYNRNTGALQNCTNTNGTGACGGGVATGFNRTAWRYLANPVERYTLDFNAHYDITDGVTAFLEGEFLHNNAHSHIEPFPFCTSAGSCNGPYVDGQMPIETLFNGVIYRNPFVPDAIFNDASDTNGDGLRDIFVQKRLTDFGSRAERESHNSFRMVGGFRGDITDNWNYEVFGNYGQTDVNLHGNGQYNVQNFVFSQQIVPDGTGGFMCADELARSHGCIPANVFGLGSLAPATSYLEAAQFYQAYQKQLQVGANLSGSFNNPLGADDIGITIGTEYRKETQDSRWDALQSAGLNGSNALPPTHGTFNVKEAYGEALVPLVTDSFIHELSVRGAVRFSDYSSVGNTFSWNAGGEFAPIRDIRFRGMYAVTVRAPNISELYAGLSQDFPTVSDPCEGIGATGGGALGENCRAAPGVLANIAQNGTFTVSQADRQGVTSFAGGNPNLQEEKGKTLTLGAVINPVSLGLGNVRLSVDYFRVKIRDAIVSTPLQFILDQCYNQGDPNYCSFVTRRAAQSGPNNAGSLFSVNSGPTNSGGIKTSGIDAVLDVTQPVNLGSLRLRTNLNVAYTHLLSGYVIPLPGADKDLFGGEVGAAKDRFTATAGIGTDMVKWTLTGTYIGPSWIDDQFDGPKKYRVHSEFYLDTQIRLYAKDGMEFYVGADNLLDNSPPYFAGVNGAVTGLETDSGTYDPFGRSYYAGVKLGF